PVFHDDQHGTAICVAAAVRNGLRVVGKELSEVRLVCSGAGAAALACLDLLVGLGLSEQNVTVVDLDGVIYRGREAGMNPFNARWAKETEQRSLAEAMVGADVFLGLSAGGVLKGDMVARMAERPLILALANPDPEIMPEEAKLAKPDAVIATGRSDYPNQVNNVLCFPFLFRGALDVGATAINDEMKQACVNAIADLAMAESSDIVAKAYGQASLSFGPEYLIPKPFDPRLIVAVAPAVAQAAMDSGVATRPIADLAAYRQRLQQRVYRTGFAMKPLFDRARSDPRRVVYCEGEDERVLRAVQISLDDGYVEPVLIGRLEIIAQEIERLGLRLEIGEGVAVLDPRDYPDFERYAEAYHKRMARRGGSPDQARSLLHTRQTLIGTLMLTEGDADALICGTVGRFDRHLEFVHGVIGVREGVREPSALELLIHDDGLAFICDTAVSDDPGAEQIAEMAVLAADQVRRFGLEPKVALLSHSDFGSSDGASAVKMRRARELAKQLAPELEIDGEMRADSALAEHIRERLFPGAELTGAANLLVMPNLDAANIAFNMSKVVADGISVGPMLIGMAMPAHVVSPSITVRGLVNMTAIAVVDAQVLAQGELPLTPALRAGAAE
ncbi:MAG: phosphate acyltransferase, partial [Alphaproteobacteria bacterium]|nr:phosphate acyltransferase [Alphaproteobacteria bacterium]